MPNTHSVGNNQCVLMTNVTMPMMNRAVLAPGDRSIVPHQCPKLRRLCRTARAIGSSFVGIGAFGDAWAVAAAPTGSKPTPGGGDSGAGDCFSSASRTTEAVYTGEPSASVGATDAGIDDSHPITGDVVVRPSGANIAATFAGRLAGSFSSAAAITLRYGWSIPVRSGKAVRCLTMIS